MSAAIHWYRSKVDWWLALLLIFMPVVSISVCVALVVDGKTAQLPWGLVGVLLLLVVYFGLVFPMRYGIDDAHLHVRYGLCRQRVPLAEIIEVHRSRNPISSPALSLDRLHVQFGAGIFQAVLISPNDRDRFLDELAEKAGLQRDGDRLQRV